MCICPPALIATTAATVPPVRHAVHRFTAAYEPRHKTAAQKPPCAPVQHKTFASELPDLGGDAPIDLNNNALTNGALSPPLDSLTNVGPGIGGQPSLLSPGPGFVTNQDAGDGAVPEPSMWITMTIGFGMIGAGFRQSRRRAIRGRTLATPNGFGVGSDGPAKGSGTMLGGGFAAATSGMMAIGGSPLQASTRLAQLGGKSLHSAFLAKAAMCICPPVAMMVGTATIPPVRHAVFKATAPSAPRTPRQAPATLTQAPPCLPTNQLTAAETVTQSGGEQLAVLPETRNWPTSTGGE